MDPIVRDAYDATRNLTDKPFRSACYAPFASLYFDTTGSVVACCQSAVYELGNVMTQRLHDIWRGEKALAMRRSLRDYALESGCNLCKWQIEGAQYDQVYARLFDHLPATDPDGNEWPAQMEFALTNTCNLECIMCSGLLSSSIRAHREKLPPLPRAYGDRFFADLREFLPHLRTAKFFGGEPFLSQENFRVWDTMIEDGVSFPFHVTTNGTQHTRKVEQVLEAFPVSLAVSLDGATRKTMESIRVNADFDAARANVVRFLAYTRRRGTTFGLTYCLMQQNWHELGAYLEYAEGLGVRVYVNTVTSPAHCSLFALPVAEMDAIAKKMEATGESARYGDLPLNGGVWRAQLAAIRKNASERQRQGVRDISDAWQEQKALRRAWEMVAQRKLEEAIAAAREVPPSHREYYEALILQVHALRLAGRVDESAEIVARAIDLHPRGPHGYVERAHLHLHRDEHAAAYRDALRADELIGTERTHPLYAQVKHAITASCYHLGRYEEGLAAAEIAIELEPHNEWFQLGRTRCLEGLARSAADRSAPAPAEGQRREPPAA